jgi:hypothetical protein
MKRDDDFDLANEFFKKVVRKAEKTGEDALTVKERVVLSIWHASGIIGNGGFQYFFEQDLNAAEVADAYEKIGCLKCADLIRKVVAAFPVKIFKSGRDQRVEFIEQNSAKFYKLSSAFWAADKKMEKQLASYIRDHAAARHKNSPP